MTIAAPPVIAALREAVRSGTPIELAPADMLAIVDHVAALTLEAARHAAHVDRILGRDDESRRKLAEAAQIRVSADNVSHNADKRVREMWRMYNETRALLVAVLGVVDTIDPHKRPDGISDEQHRALEAARAAMKVADLGPPGDGK